MLSGTWYLPLIVVLLSVVYHERIAAREEAFLLSAFGDTFRAWANEVALWTDAAGATLVAKDAVSETERVVRLRRVTPSRLSSSAMSRPSRLR